MDIWIWEIIDRQSTNIMGADCISLIILRNVKLHPHDMPNLTNQIEMFTENWSSSLLIRLIQVIFAALEFVVIFSGKTRNHHKISAIHFLLLTLWMECTVVRGMFHFLMQGRKHEPIFSCNGPIKKSSFSWYEISLAKSRP